MISRLSKKKIANFFTYYGILYIVLCILIVTGWYYLLNAIDEVKSYEKINIFAETYGYNDELENNLYSYLKENDETKSIYQVSIYQFASDNSKLNDYYTSFGVSADLLILTGEDLVDMQEYIDNKFVALDNNLITTYLGNTNYQYYSYNDKAYGIKIYDKDDSSYSYLSNYFTYKQEGKADHSYYLLINKSSVNIGEYGQECQTSNALLSIKYLLG